MKNVYDKVSMNGGMKKVFNLNRKIVNYYGVGYKYRDHGDSGLDAKGRKEWREARRVAFKEMKAMGFKGTLDTTDKKKAEAYCQEWNTKYKSANILGPLEVYEYSYL